MSHAKESKGNKKIFIFILIAIVVIIGIVYVLLNKGDNSIIQGTKNYYYIGDTVKTDIAEFTLNNSELAIALSNVKNETYYTPVEYNSEQHQKNPFVADTGCTLVYIDFTLSAIDRSNVDVDETNFISVKYKNKNYNDKYHKTTYRNLLDFGMLKQLSGKTNGEFSEYNSNNILLHTGDKVQVRGNYQIPTDVDSLKDTYYITFKLPTSNGKTNEFTYAINETEK